MSLKNVYSPLWQGYVMYNYLFYSSLVVHFLRFCHKFITSHTDTIVEMVKKLLCILTSSNGLMELLKKFDTVYHSQPAGANVIGLPSLFLLIPLIFGFYAARFFTKKSLPSYFMFVLLSSLLVVWFVVHNYWNLNIWLVELSLRSFFRLIVASVNLAMAVPGFALLPPKFRFVTEIGLAGLACIPLVAIHFSLDQSAKRFIVLVMMTSLLFVAIQPPIPLSWAL